MKPNEEQMKTLDFSLKLPRPTQVCPSWSGLYGNPDALVSCWTHRHSRIGSTEWCKRSMSCVILWRWKTIQWNTGTARSVALQLLCQSRPYKWSAFGDSCRFLYQWYIIIPLYFSHLVSSYCSVQVAGRAFSRENQLGIQVLLGLLRLKRLWSLGQRFMNGEYLLAGTDLGRGPSCLIQGRECWLDWAQQV